MPDLHTARRDGVELDRTSDAVDDGAHCVSRRIRRACSLPRQSTSSRAGSSGTSGRSSTRTRTRQSSASSRRRATVSGAHPAGPTRRTRSHVPRRNFYKEQHGTPPAPARLPHALTPTPTRAPQKSRRLRSTSGCARISASRRARAWASGARWRCSTRSWTTRTQTRRSRRSSTSCRPRRRCAATASPSGCRSSASCTTSGSCCSCLAPSACCAPSCVYG